jgi:hypothetical protein
MSQAISKAFYDKTVYLMSNEVTTDAEGGVSYRGLEITGNFKGNVSFSNCKKIQEEYGLDYEIDISITTSIDTSININDIIKYNDVIYNVTDILATDSHILIVATKWCQ